MKPVRCWRRSIAGSPRGLTRPTCKQPGRCWRGWTANIESPFNRAIGCWCFDRLSTNGFSSPYPLPRSPAGRIQDSPLQAHSGHIRAPSRENTRFAPTGALRTHPSENRCVEEQTHSAQASGLCCYITSCLLAVPPARLCSSVASLIASNKFLAAGCSATVICFPRRWRARLTLRRQTVIWATVRK